MDRAPGIEVTLGPRTLPARCVLAGPFVAAATVLMALVATSEAGVPLRDPSGVAFRRFHIAAGLVALLMVLEVVIRASRGGSRRLPSLADVRRAWRERWTPARLGIVALALVSFYATYLAYRNLKSVVALLRPDVLFDGDLADLERSVFAGSDPASLLHSLLGTGIAAHGLSFVYDLFFLFVPLSIAFALVVLPDLRAGLFYVTAQSLNWVLAAGSYFLLPALGPIYAEPANFAALPHTAVTDLQNLLLDQRTEFLRDPAAPGAAQSIGAFASLHCSIFFTAAFATQLLGLGRSVKIVVWTLLALTVLATIYLGWHYVVDDLGGLLIAVCALALARALTGVDPRTTARRIPAPDPAPA